MDMRRSGEQASVWLILSAILICVSMSPVAMAQSSSLHQSTDQMAPGKEMPVMPDNSAMLTKIKLKFAVQKAVLELNDNPPSRDLVSMLPLTVKFSDDNAFEKIAFPPRWKRSLTSIWS